MKRIMQQTWIEYHIKLCIQLGHQSFAAGAAPDSVSLKAWNNSCVDAPLNLPSPVSAPGNMLTLTTKMKLPSVAPSPPFLMKPAVLLTAGCCPIWLNPPFF